jgi:HAD superfamily hydrolase (TIGR01459 family)
MHGTKAPLSAAFQTRAFMASRIPLIDGLAALGADYDAFVIDLWGVIHDGVTLYPGVIEALQGLAATGKPYVMLTNAPRRAAALNRAVLKMGMPAGLCDAIMSSGEATHLALRDMASDPFFAGVGPRCLHIGPARDENLFDGLTLERVKDAAGADLIVNTGPWEDDETVADYEDVLQAGAAADLPMVCANPDLEVIRGGKRVICAGALALRYEELGGRVRWYGKPHRPIYETSFRLLGIDDPRRALAIGDSLRTDIAGAAACGMDSVLVLGGLHGAELAGPDGRAGAETRIAARCAEAGLAPVAAIERFIW